MGHSPNPPHVPIGSEVIDPRTEPYLCKWDGVTDDTVGFVLAVAASAGKTLLIPPGIGRLASLAAPLDLSVARTVIGGNPYVNQIKIPAFIPRVAASAHIGTNPCLILGTLGGSNKDHSVLGVGILGPISNRPTPLTGVPRAGFDGVTLNGKLLLRDVLVMGFDANLVINCEDGRLTLDNVTSSFGYYNAYSLQNRDDNLFKDCNFGFADCANYATDYFTADDVANCVFTKHHCGFSPYGIYQRAGSFTRWSSGNHYDLVKLEKVSMAGIYAEFGVAGFITAVSVDTLTITNANAGTGTIPAFDASYIGKRLDIGGGLAFGTVTAQSPTTLTVAAWVGTVPTAGQDYAVRTTVFADNWADIPGTFTTVPAPVAGLYSATDATAYFGHGFPAKLPYAFAISWPGGSGTVQKQTIGNTIAFTLGAGIAPVAGQAYNIRRPVLTGGMRGTRYFQTAYELSTTSTPVLPGSFPNDFHCHIGPVDDDNLWWPGRSSMFPTAYINDLIGTLQSEGTTQPAFTFGGASTHGAGNIHRVMPTIVTQRKATLTVVPSTVANTNGVTQSLTPTAPTTSLDLRYFSITTTGVSAETVTVILTVTMSDGSTRTFTKTFTTNTNYFAALIDLETSLTSDGKTPVSWSAVCKSNINSSAASVDVVFAGTQL